MKGIPVLVLSLVLSCVALEAQGASYLFGLTEREIDDVMQYYHPRGDYDRDEVLRSMSAPFDCRPFGDLCREVGDRFAEQIVETAWTYGRRFEPAETIDRIVQHDFEALSRRWFESNYPNGLREDDPYFGVPRAAGSSCDDTVSATVGDFRVVHKSRRFTTIFLRAFGRIKVEHFKRNLLGNFEQRKADRLEVEGTVTFLQANFEPFNVPLFDSKEDVKEVADTRGFGLIGLFRVPFVEGCGGVPNSGLFACSCSGTPTFVP